MKSVQGSPPLPLTLSTDQPLPFVDVEFHGAFIPHPQQERPTRFFVRHIRASHDFVDFQRFLAECG
jgi:hypothetical protein